MTLQSIRPLIVQVGGADSSRPSLAFARALIREWPGATLLSRGAVSDALANSDGVLVRMGAGSMVRDTITMDFGVPIVGDPELAASIGASSTAWEGRDAWESWRDLYKAKVCRPTSGIPRPDRHWAVVEADASVPPGLIGADWQIHRISGRGVASSEGEVNWDGRRAPISWLLGRADVVIGRAGPLVYDGLRARVPSVVLLHGNGYTDLHGATLRSSEHALAALANTLSPSMLRCEGVRQATMDRLRSIEAGAGEVEPLMSSELVIGARESEAKATAACPPVVSKAARKTRKLIRDPEAFFSDSNHPLLHGAGKLLARRTSRPPHALRGRWVE